MGDDPTTPGDAGMIRPFLVGPGNERAPLDLPEPANAVRPFLLTRGRTAADASIAVETQVAATPAGRRAVSSLSLEYRDIVLACEQPLAVAEVAAMLDLHLGVARVLISDLTQQGMVSTEVPDGDAADDVETIMRVIDGLRQRT